MWTNVLFFLQKMESMLKQAWDAEGSPFKGQPFDMSKVNISNDGQNISFNQWMNTGYSGKLWLYCWWRWVYTELCILLYCYFMLNMLLNIVKMLKLCLIPDIGSWFKFIFCYNVMFDMCQLKMYDCKCFIAWLLDCRKSCLR